MSNVISFNEKKKSLYENLIGCVEFGMHTLKTVTEYGLLKKDYFIVLKDKSTGVVLEVTPYSKYLRYYNKPIDTRTEETIRAKGLVVCNFLNYVFFYKYDEYRITKIEDISIQQGNDFLLDYANGQLDKYKKRSGNIEPRSRTTVKLAIQELTRFYNYIKKTYGKKATNLHGEEIYTMIRKQNLRTGDVEEIPQSVFRIRPDKYKKKTIQIRDIWDDVLIRMFELCEKEYPEITLALALQAFGGLRASEVCNCRQESSPLGGTKIMKAKNKMMSFEVDLTVKRNMRSDCVDVGDIKTPGEQNIYDKYLETFSKIYYKHVKWLEKQEYEKEYAPLFINKDGMAMTYKSYYRKFKRLVEILRDDLLDDENESLQTYGLILTQYSLSTHALRHWFTVQLVLDGLTPNEIANWRRDSSLESAKTYCSKKQSLNKRYKQANNALFEKVIGERY